MWKFYPEKVGARIRLERQQKHMLAKDLAEQLLMEPCQISKLERGVALSPDKVALVANVLGLDPREIMNSGFVDE